MTTERALYLLSPEEAKNVVLIMMSELKHELRDKEILTAAKMDKIIENQGKYEESITINFKEVNKYMNSISIEVAKLQIKSGIWGVIGGIIPAVGAILWVILAT